MLRLLSVWWHILTSAGPGMRAGRQADRLFKYYLLMTLNEVGIFEYLQEPRTYGQILAKFHFIDSEYTREILSTLVLDKDKILIKENGEFHVNQHYQLPSLEEILLKTDRRIRSFILLAEGMARSILPRLRHEPLGLSESFEKDGRQLLAKFDRVLGNSIYSSMRNAAFAYLTHQDRNWLRGKDLLDIGCGSGRETAEIWLRFDGDIQITAIDAISSMLELAEKNFEIIIREINPLHAPLSDSNRPIFKKASATRLPFDDNSFDAAFWLYILHWTPDPRRAISEAVRVVKPGGLIFGGQVFKPEANPYFDLMIRSNENCHGFFWREDYRSWFAEHNVELDMATPAGMFRVRK